MISWLRSKTQQRWTRRTCWTPLLLNQRQLQRILAKERTRADREDNVFGFIILRVVDMQQVRSTTMKLAKILHRRLRETDEKGHLNYGRLGVILPATGDEGTQYVLSDILRLARAAQLNIDGEAFVYPQRPNRDDEFHQDHGGFESDGDVLVERVTIEGSSTFAGTAEDFEIADDFAAENDFGRVAPPCRNSTSARFTESPMTTGLLAVQPCAVVEQRSAHVLSVVPIELCVCGYPVWKRTLDLIGATIGLLLALPILIVSAWIIRLTSAGPAFFAQQRIGYLGRPFWIYKLRTMVVNAEDLKPSLLQRNERDGPAFKMRHDPRITRFGALLRSTGLDELPQLFNVLRGDMSLVGPRPLPVSEANQCTAWQRARMNTKPGLTCYWQLAKSRKMSFVEWMRLDLRYARASNLWLDTKLILHTFSAVVLGRVGH